MIWSFGRTGIEVLSLDILTLVTDADKSQCSNMVRQRDG